MAGNADYNFVPGVATPYVVATEGSELILADGRRILDGGGGAIVTNIGHGRPEIAEVAARTTSTVDYVIPPWNTPSRRRRPQAHHPKTCSAPRATAFAR